MLGIFSSLSNALEYFYSGICKWIISCDSYCICSLLTGLFHVNDSCNWVKWVNFLLRKYCILKSCLSHFFLFLKKSPTGRGLPEVREMTPFGSWNWLDKFLRNAGFYLPVCSSDWSHFWIFGCLLKFGKFKLSLYLRV